MHLTKDDRIAGYPALKVRDILRRAFGRELARVSERDALAVLRCSQRAARALLAALEALGHVEGRRDSNSSPRGSRTDYMVTQTGLRLANGSGSPPFSRAKAEQLLAKCIAAARIRNSEPGHAWGVRRLYVCGSYLSKKAMLNDLDIILETGPRACSRTEFQRLLDEGYHRAPERLSYLERLNWDEARIPYLIRGRDGRISILRSHTLAFLEAEGQPVRIVFEDVRFRDCRVRRIVR